MKTKKKTPDPTVAILEELNRYVALARYEWTTYLTLYSDSATREILDRTAPPFFSTLQLQMRSSVVLSLARLFDRNIPEQRNLTLYALLDAVKATADPDLVSSLAQRVDEARAEAEPIRQERHKRIAHLDWETMLSDPRAWDVPEQQISSLLEKVESIVDQADRELRGVAHFRHVYSDLAKVHVAQLVGKLPATEL